MREIPINGLKVSLAGHTTKKNLIPGLYQYYCYCIIVYILLVNIFILIPFASQKGLYDDKYIDSEWVTNEGRSPVSPDGKRMWPNPVWSSP